MIYKEFLLNHLYIYQYLRIYLLIDLEECILLRLYR